MSIILNNSLVEALANEVKKSKRAIRFFEGLPDFKELNKMSSGNNPAHFEINGVFWVTTHNRLQKLISIESRPDSIELISLDVEGGDIWSLVLPQEEESDYGRSRIVCIDKYHDFTNYDEEDDIDYENYWVDPDPEEIAEAIAERYGVSQEDDE